MSETREEPQVVEFFHDRYDRRGREAPAMRESTLNKIGAFSLNPRLKLMLGQEANHLDFRAIMDEGKILLLDLGRSDGETDRLIGSLVATGLELAMRRRKSQGIGCGKQGVLAANKLPEGELLGILHIIDSYPSSPTLSAKGLLPLQVQFRQNNEQPHEQ